MTRERTLAGWRVVVTRPEGRTAALEELLRERGAEPVLVPAIRTVPLGVLPERAVLRGEMGAASILILTSATTVTLLDGILPASEWPIGLDVICVGKATAEALALRGHAGGRVAADSRQEGLLAMLEECELYGSVILMPQAAGARTFLEESLRERGADVRVLPLYRSECRPIPPDLLLELAGRPPRAMLVTSPSSVEALVPLLEAWPGPPPVTVAIGPATAEALARQGVNPLVAEEASDEAMVACLVQVAATMPQSSKRD